jgi:amidohydrolase
VKEKIKSFAEKYFAEIVALRRHLHANPELSFEEYNTSAFVCSKLDEWGISYKNGIVKTGIVALIEGKNPEKKSIALRADLDALPIKEENNKEYISKNIGVMHACGHDVHTSSLLGAAKILNELRNEFEGTVKLIFQPGEEKLPGGASLMINEKVLENPKPVSIFAQHVFPSMETGKVGFRPGMYMASTDEIYITVKGKGGHAAMPANYVNPLLISSKLILALHAEFMDEKTRSIPNIPTVLAFGKITGMGATNVIPDEVKIEGTFRTMDEKWREEAHEKMKDIAAKVFSENGGSGEFNILKGYPFLVNDETLTNNAIVNAKEFLGDEKVELLDLRMTAEDFAFYSQHIPACFYRLGTGNKKLGIDSGVHTSTFDIDEEALKTGMGLMTWLAICELK